MPNNIKDIKNRMRSIQSTIQITKAMELVSSSKLRKAKQRAEKIRPFFNLLYQTITDIVYENKDFSSVYTVDRKSNNSLFIVIAGDRGLAGGYNSNIYKFALENMKSKDVQIIAIGAKAIEYFSRRNYNIINSYSNFAEYIEIESVYEISNLICNLYKSNKIDKVCIIYTMFISPLNQQPQVLDILPLALSSGNISNTKIKKMITYDPSPQEVFDNIVPQYISGIIFGAVLESYASEQAARRLSMESATDNGQEILDSFSLKYNRARQSLITQEISEIVAGANSASLVD